MDVGKLQDEQLGLALGRLERFEKRLYEKVVAYLAILSTQGVLQPNAAQLAVLRNQIINWYQELGYADIINEYIAQLDKVDELNRQYYGSKLDRIRVEQEIIKAPINAEYRRQLAENLRGAGAVEALVKPIEQLIRTDALRGLTFEQAATELQNLIAPEDRAGIARSTFEQVSKDALMQYDGIIQEELQKVFKPTKGVYLASVIETTRPICDHIKDRFGNREIEVSELRAILNEYAPGGVPSKEKITYETVKGEVRTLQKGSGMIPGTTAENFYINRGGYNCRHSWRWVF